MNNRREETSQRNQIHNTRCVQTRTSIEQRHRLPNSVVEAIEQTLVDVGGQRDRLRVALEPKCGRVVVAIQSEHDAARAIVLHRLLRTRFTTCATERGGRLRRFRAEDGRAVEVDGRDESNDGAVVGHDVERRV